VGKPSCGRKGIKEKLFLWWRLRRHRKNNILIPPSSAVKRWGERGQGEGAKKIPSKETFSAPSSRGDKGGGIMNVLNRILVVLGLLIALPLGIALCVAPMPILGAMGQGLNNLVS
jgi:hypothetical protein